MKLPLRNDCAAQQCKFERSIEMARLLAADEHLIEEAVACRWLGMCPASLLKLRQAGKGPRYCVMARRIMYRRSDLTRWINGQINSRVKQAA